MTAAAAAHLTGAGLKVGAAIAFALPQVLAGPFIFGTMIGGEQAGKAMETGAEIAEALGEGLSVLGELYGTRVEHERQVDEWNYQVMLAKADHRELGHQVSSARAQLVQAQRELEIIDQEIADLDAVAAFLTGKFTNAELYQWKAGRLALDVLRQLRPGPRHRQGGRARLPVRTGRHRDVHPAGLLGEPPLGPALRRGPRRRPRTPRPRVRLGRRPGLRDHQADLAAPDRPAGRAQPEERRPLRVRPHRGAVRPGLPRPLQAPHQDRLAGLRRPGGPAGGERRAHPDRAQGGAHPRPEGRALPARRQGRHAAPRSGPTGGRPSRSPCRTPSSTATTTVCSSSASTTSATSPSRAPARSRRGRWRSPAAARGTCST